MNTITLSMMIFGCLTMAALAGEISFDDGHWYHPNSKGKQINAVPNRSTIDGKWFREGTHINGVGSYTRDRYGNFIEY